MHFTKESRILPIIVLSQFAGTSLWFAGNAIISELQVAFHLPEGSVGALTSAVQLGFISGTLVFALLTLSDRYSPSKVFFICALAGAIANVLVYVIGQGYWSLLSLRFATGFFLAGIYPVGMKIAADWHRKGLGKALGYLVGALVVGTAFPHLIKTFLQELPWPYVLCATSAFAIAGGLLILVFVPDGPYHKRSPQPDIKAFFKVFQKPDFKAAATGYFGHMWELYSLWAFLPFILRSYIDVHPGIDWDISLLSFFTIGIGGLSCVAGGYFSLHYGSAKVAFVALLTSGLCCMLSPLAFYIPSAFFLLFLLIWGMAVVADSPQFSTLVSQTAPQEKIGTALTIVNCIGFAITIVSIQLMTWLLMKMNSPYSFLLLAIGPAIGLLSIRKLLGRKQAPFTKNEVLGQLEKDRP
ncbi:MFS transporter [Rapidithrix thailandica]|uniref:MFS transporter n=1 Tax=Rapidithrix thailandica TaxID=413964 RepID=A0AAW9S3N2_9BACT